MYSTHINVFEQYGNKYGNGGYSLPIRLKNKEI